MVPAKGNYPVSKGNVLSFVQESNIESWSRTWTMMSLTSHQLHTTERGWVVLHHLHHD